MLWRKKGEEITIRLSKVRPIQTNLNDFQIQLIILILKFNEFFYHLFDKIAKNEWLNIILLELKNKIVELIFLFLIQ